MNSAAHGGAAAEHGANATRGRPGGRAERVVAAVLHATTAELARVGFAALQIDGIAQLAGVARTTIYRRWPTKIELVGDAVRSLRQADDIAVVDTGDLEHDLSTLVVHLARGCTDAKRGVWRMIMAEGDQPEVARLVKQLRAELDEEFAVRLRAAVARGELRPDIDVQLLVETILGAVSSRLFMRRRDVDAEYVAAIVSLFLDGARLPVEKRAHAPKATPRRAAR